MENKTPTGLQNSGTNAQLRQVLSHLQIASPAEGDPTCQACGEPLLHADPVTLYLSRPAGRSGYTVGQCRCSDHNDDLTSLFALGTRELVVDGRVGQCRDQDSHQTGSILLAPSIRLISPADTKSGRRIKNHSKELGYTDDQQHERTTSAPTRAQANCTELYDQPNTNAVQTAGGRQ